MGTWLLIMVDGSGLLVPERILSLISYVSSPFCIIPSSPLYFLLQATPRPPCLPFLNLEPLPSSAPFLSLRSRVTNPQRIFNTITQSEKCDPNGDYIRYWVPELKHLKGKAIHDPYHNMPKSEFKKLGYPEPIVDHKTARLRALFRYKNVGEKEEGA
jgi:hypothetical protein